MKLSGIENLDMMTYPMCQRIIYTDKHDQPFICPCGWRQWAGRVLDEHSRG